MKDIYVAELSDIFTVAKAEVLDLGLDVQITPEFIKKMFTDIQKKEYKPDLYFSLGYDNLKVYSKSMVMYKTVTYRFENDSLSIGMMEDWADCVRCYLQHYSCLL